MSAEPAVIDTSFWTIGHRADLIQYLFASFTVHVPPAVRAEILRPDPRYPRRRYGYAELFQLLERQGLLPAAAPPESLSRFGPGEAEALVVAREHRWRLLINDRRPLEYVRALHIRALSVPGYIYRLYAQEVISVASAERKLSLIAPLTSASLLRPVERAVDRLARKRKER